MRETSTSKSVYSGLRGPDACKPRSSAEVDVMGDRDSSLLVSMTRRYSDTERCSSNGGTGSTLKSTAATLAHGLGGGGGGLGPRGRLSMFTRGLELHIETGRATFEGFSDIDDVVECEKEESARKFLGRGSNAGGGGRRANRVGLVVSSTGETAMDPSCLMVGTGGGGRRVAMIGALARGVGEVSEGSTRFIGRGVIGEVAVESTDGFRESPS